MQLMDQLVNTVPPSLTSVEQKATREHEPAPFPKALGIAVKRMGDSYFTRLGWVPEWDQKDIADSIGIHETVWSRLRGTKPTKTLQDPKKRKPTVEVVRRIAQFFQQYIPEWDEDYWMEQAGYLTYALLMRWLDEHQHWKPAARLKRQMMVTVTDAWRQSASPWKARADDLLARVNRRLHAGDESPYQQMGEIIMELATYVSGWELNQRD